MQKVRQRRHGPGTKAAKQALLPDRKNMGEAMLRLADVDAVLSAPPDLQGDLIAQPLRQERSSNLVAVETSRGQGARTVVERLRDRLDQCIVESQPEIRVLHERPSTAWLPGRPCTLEATKCVQSLNLLGEHHLMLPCVPMVPQVAVAERVLRACDQKSVAMLQSPTGTGKSIALLSAALAWQRRAFAQHGCAPQIIYGVRTHVQAQQMVTELRKMPYRPRMAIIGSREQLCINEEVKARARQRRMSLNNACRQAARVAVRPNQRRMEGDMGAGCMSYAHLGDSRHAQRTFERCGRQGALWDIEDLVNTCKTSGDHGGCPYYSAHVLAGSADIVFCPHNYVLDPAISQCRSHHRERWSLEERIIIIDEAHNLEQACRDAGSVVVSLAELRQLITALEAFPKRRPNLRIRMRGQDLHCQDVCEELLLVPQLLAKFLVTSNNAVAQQGLAGVASATARNTNGQDMLSGLSRVWGVPGHPPSTEFAREAGLAGRTVLSEGREELCVEIIDRLLRFSASGDSAVQDAALLGMMDRLHELLTKLRLAVTHADYYVMGVALENDNSSDSSKSLSVWLMAPGVIFDTFSSKAHAVVLASGTLSPLGALSVELAASATILARSQQGGPLEVAHVVDRSQVLVAVVPCFPSSGRTVLATYERWRCAIFLADLGRSIVSISDSIPGGVLCFFPSYAALDACVAAWRTHSKACIWDQLVQAKGVIVVESRASDGLSDACAAYIQAVHGSVRGALGLAVYRGKFSEGLSLNDDLCRGVVCIGVPYPQTKDPVVIAKRRWNDAQRASSSQRHALSGNEWYELQAYRAINQALGRCVRHPLDFGALILLDARWASQGEHARGLKRHLAHWLQHFVEEVSALGDRGLLNRLRAHFSLAARAVGAKHSVGDSRSSLALHGTAPGQLMLGSSAPCGVVSTRPAASDVRMPPRATNQLNVSEAGRKRPYSTVVGLA